jgi:hypothetical protein
LAGLPFFFLFVIPAKTGIQGCKSVPVALDPGFRRGDGGKIGPNNPYAIALPHGGNARHLLLQ